MNKITAVVATFVALRAGTLGVRAFDLKGSDTLKRLTLQVINDCPGATGAINYVGLGSGVGENALIAGTQTIAPMSRFLAGSGTSCVCAVDTALVEAIEIAGDALVNTASDAHRAACDPLSGSPLGLGLHRLPSWRQLNGQRPLGEYQDARYRREHQLVEGHGTPRVARHGAERPALPRGHRPWRPGASDKHRAQGLPTNPCLF